jgi:hypothetical protein
MTDLSGFERRMIAEIEQIIDKGNKRLVALREELEEVEDEQTQARALLRKLKGGPVASQRAVRRQVPTGDYVDAMRALGEFSTIELAELVGVSRNAARQWCATHTDLVTRINGDAKVGEPARYRCSSQEVE